MQGLYERIPHANTQHATLQQCRQQQLVSLVKSTLAWLEQSLTQNRINFSYSSFLTHYQLNWPIPEHSLKQ